RRSCWPPYGRCSKASRRPRSERPPFTRSRDRTRQVKNRPTGDSDFLQELAQLPQAVGLDLAHALAGEAKGLPDLPERPGFLAVEAETEAQHGGVTRVHLIEQAEDLFHLLGPAQPGAGVGLVVRGHLAQREAGAVDFLLRGRVVDAQGFLDDLQ